MELAIHLPLNENISLIHVGKTIFSSTQSNHFQTIKERQLQNNVVQQYSLQKKKKNQHYLLIE
jgi:hypothetical protein